MARWERAAAGDVDASGWGFCTDGVLVTKASIVRCLDLLATYRVAPPWRLAWWQSLALSAVSGRATAGRHAATLGGQLWVSAWQDWHHA